ncbi:MAG: response regulator [Acidobacteria bacterium]|uniref:Response regulator n=1 Tax=Candidatus Polarisedimenticola svalbardensis TaxID=2886004 RepID=A0A8J7CDD4_9BACT|nr:response regulator [Candidatus Polarisedimenticola svalbardensis]
MSLRVKKVLIVDDDAAVLLGLPAVLESPAVQVATAASLHEACTLLTSQSVDLVITDLRLRGQTDTDGMELISWIKERYPETEVALITGLGSVDLRDEALRRGASAYWEKSISMPDLVARVNALGIPAGGTGS